MRITKFEAENFKRLKAVSFEPDGNTVVISGRNAQGKSSVLDAIMATLSGAKGSKEIVRPIRDGETKASVVIELEDLRVERKWTPSGTTVVVGPKDGAAKLNSPQAVLDKLIGALSFDPLAFAESSPRDQVETLIDLIGRAPFEALENERKQAYSERTDVNRDAKRLKAQLDALPDGVEGEKIDLAVLGEEVRIAHQRADLSRKWTELNEEIQRLQVLQGHVVEQGQALPASRGLDELEVELVGADQHNQAVERHEKGAKLREELHDAEVEAERLTAKIEECVKDKAGLIASAKLPVDGLTFDEDGVSYNGVPFIQSSAAERLKVSVAMAMAMNPELKVISIRDASLLDQESMETLIAMATEHDYQIWYEVVGESEIGVIIEDGEVKS